MRSQASSHKLLRAPACIRPAQHAGCSTLTESVLRHVVRSIGEAYTAPGPGTYPLPANYSGGKPCKKLDSQRGAFRSRSQQRPSSGSLDVPGAGAYSPNMASIYPHQRNSGANMRSRRSRFDNTDATTPRHMGPGKYAQCDRTLYGEAQKATERSSRVRPGFGSTSEREMTFLRAPKTPSPGEHQPLQGGRSLRTPRESGRQRTPRSKAQGGPLDWLLNEYRAPVAAQTVDPAAERSVEVERFLQAM